MSRHAAPLSDYADAERSARLVHDQMLADALAHLDGLATRWVTPTEKPYVLDATTGTLIAILAG